MGFVQSVLGHNPPPMAEVGSLSCLVDGAFRVLLA